MEFDGNFKDKCLQKKPREEFYEQLDIVINFCEVDNTAPKRINKPAKPNFLPFLIKSNIIFDTDTCRDIIHKAASKPVCRTILGLNLFDGVSATLEEKSEFLKTMRSILTDKIIYLLYSVTENGGNQEMFDKKHHEICQELIALGNKFCRIPYGVMQMWLNGTLMNLIVVDEKKPFEKLPVKTTRKYYHVPVLPFVVEAAITDSCQIDVDHYEQIPESRLWGYSDYMNFQIAVRNRIHELVLTQERNYKDPLDWLFRIYEEAKSENEISRRSETPKGEV